MTDDLRLEGYSIAEKGGLSNNSEYLLKLQSLLSSRTDINWSLVNDSSIQPKVFFTDGTTEHIINGSASLIDRSKIQMENDELAICIIEDITAEYVQAIGKEWDIEPEFFLSHATNPKFDRIWAGQPWEWDDKKHLAPKERDRNFLGGRFDHLDGVFEYHNTKEEFDSLDLKPLNISSNFISRHCKKVGKWPVQSNTRISYCRPHPMLYLFLVDAPLQLPPSVLDLSSASVPTLRFPNAISRGGVLLPRQLSTGQLTVFRCLKSFFQHPWHLRVLFNTRQIGLDPLDGVTVDPTQNVLPSPPFLYLFSSSLHEDNLRYLAKEIKTISFKHIRNPNLEINTILHDRREDLATLKDSLAEATMWVPTSVESYFAVHPYWVSVNGTGRSMSPILHLKRIIEEATELQAFLMETFQLFMSSVAVQESRMAMRQAAAVSEQAAMERHATAAQAARANQLTTLAFIYVPLSFVTGIFGMNVQQMNGSGLDLWVCFVAVFVVGLITFLLFWTVRLRAFQKDRKPWGKEEF